MKTVCGLLGRTAEKNTAHCFHTSSVKTVCVHKCENNVRSARPPGADRFHTSTVKTVCRVCAVPGENPARARAWDEAKAGARAWAKARVEARLRLVKAKAKARARAAPPHALGGGMFGVGAASLDS